MLLDTQEGEAPPRAFAPAYFVATTLLGGAFVYLAFHAQRSQPAWGMEGESLRWAVAVVAAGFLGVQGWAYRRMRARRRA